VPPPDTITTGPPADDVADAATDLVDEPLAPPPPAAIDVIGSSGDLRFAWYLADRLRYGADADAAAPLVAALSRLTGVEAPVEADPWTHYVDLLLAWDVAAPPGYLEAKRSLHLAHDPTAAPFFDESTSLDWRLVTASGAARDEVVPLDDPEVVSVETGSSWLAGDEPVYGIEVAGEWRAYPRRVLRAHEIVNDTVGRRRIVVAYCEPCGSATAWAADGYGADDVPGSEGISAIDLASSGLVLAGAPLAYDETTMSLVDTFAGRAVTGALSDRNVTLEPLTVVRSTWADWSDDHGDSSVIAEDGGVGRIYPDDQAPSTTTVWPVGTRDARLAGDHDVLGVHLADGSTLAFPVADARRAVADEGELTWSGVAVALDAGGLTARSDEGDEPVASHEATWRAWSHFHPDSKLWQPGS
jgi:hypothetical protein